LKEASVPKTSDVRPWPWPEVAFGGLCLGLGFAGQVFALSLADAEKL